MAENRGRGKQKRYSEILTPVPTRHNYTTQTKHSLLPKHIDLEHALVCPF